MVSTSIRCRASYVTIARQNKGVVYNLLMKAAAETTLAIASDPKRLGADRCHRRAAHLGLGAHI